MSFPEFFSTARLQAERLSPGHLADLRRMHVDPVFMRYIGGVRDAPSTADYLARNLKHWDDFGFGLWILREGAGGESIGTAVLRHLLVEGVDEVEVGYGFYQRYWGRGLATEVATACLAFGWNELRLSTIVGVTSPENLPSQHVLSKVGLVFEREFMLEGERCALFRIGKSQGDQGDRGVGLSR